MQEQRLEHIKEKEAAAQSHRDSYNKKHYVDPGILSDDQLRQRGLHHLKQDDQDDDQASDAKVNVKFIIFASKCIFPSARHLMPR